MAEEQVSLQAVSKQLIELSLAKPPTHSFNRKLLQIVVDTVGAAAATLWLVQENELVLCEELEEAVGALEEIHVPDERQQQALRTTFEQGTAAVMENAGQGFDPFQTPGSNVGALAFIPVAGLKGSVGVIRLVFEPMSQASLSRSVQLAEALAGYYSLYGAQRILTIQHREREDIDRLSKAILQLQHYTFSRQLPEVIVNSSVEIARIDRSVLLAREDEELKLAAVSSVSDTSKKGAWSRLACELGELVLEHGQPVHHFPGRESGSEIEDDELRERLNSYCLMSEASSLLIYPLTSEREQAGVLLLESYEDQPLTTFERVLCTVFSAHAGSALTNHRLFQQVPLAGMYAKRLDREAEGVKRGPGRVKRIAKWGGGLLVAALVIWFVAIHPVPEKVEAEALVASAEERVVTARQAGEVDRVNFEEGQLVDKGDLLIRMRTDQVELELSKEVENARNIEARITNLRGQAEQEPDPRRPETDRLAELRALEHTLAAKREQIKLLRSRLEDHFLRAPISGAVIEPEHPHEMLGTFVSQGEPLCRLGSIHERALMRLAVPADRVDEVSRGQTARIRLRSLLEEELLEGRVRAIADRSVTYKNSNVFMADVYVENPLVGRDEQDRPQFLLKPGMTGKAKVIRETQSTYLSIYSRLVYRKIKYWLF